MGLMSEIAYEAAQYAKCKAKRQYQSQTVALNAAWLLGFRSKAHSSVYACGYCGHYHLSSQTQRLNALVCSL